MKGHHYRVPRGPRWKFRASFGRDDASVQSGAVYHARVHGRRVRVITALEHAVLPDGSGETGLQWHVSASYYTPGTIASRRPSDRDMKGVRWAFEMKEAEEDNHEPGSARHLWLPVDPSRRVDCECKEDEETIVEPDGHTWTNPLEGRADPSRCRGCRASPITGRPCPLHP